MKAIVWCEKSQIVARALCEVGIDARSCDILPCEHPEWGIPHIQDDALNHLTGYDLAIGHPDCTYIANSGVHWLNRQQGRWEKMTEASLFFKKLWASPIPKICLENPIPHKYALEIIGKDYDQIIQPHQFGEDASKATCLWLKGLAPLKSTKFVEPHYACRCGSTYRFEYALGKYGCPNCCGEYTARPVWANQTKSGQNKLGPSEHRQADRARTYAGIAKAMAEQWGNEKLLLRKDKLF